LRRVIEALFDAGREPEHKAYSMGCRLMHFIEKSGTYGHTVHPVRLYHKGYAGFKDSTVHDSVEWKPGREGPTGHLKGALNHRSFRSYEHMVEKINFYTTMQAQDMFRKARRPSTLRIL